MGSCSPRSRAVICAFVVLVCGGALKSQVRPVYSTGASGLTQTLERLQTTASALHVGAHPDEDGAGNWRLDDPICGDARFEGTKVILINNEEYHLYISGVVRPSDVRDDNSLSSSRIADAEVLNRLAADIDVTDEDVEAWYEEHPEQVTTPEGPLPLEQVRDLIADLLVQERLDERVQEIVAEAPLVIADGHHRYETSLHYRDECQARGDGPGEHDRIMTLVVELSEDQLAVQPIHRIVRQLPPDTALRDALDEWFEVVTVGPNDTAVLARLPPLMAQRDAMALVDEAGVALLVPRPEVIGPLVAVEPEPVRHVDAARFETAVAPLLAALGADTEYRHDRATVAQLVAKGEVRAAFLLRPVDVTAIQEVARRGERMPQKTTFFHPKPSTGLVFRSLDVV